MRRWLFCLIALYAPAALAQQAPLLPTDSESFQAGEKIALQQLAKRRAELDVREKKILQYQTNSDTGFTPLLPEERLARFYAFMKPDKAAAILNTLDDSLTIRLFQQMPPIQAAAILEHLPIEKVQKITYALSTP